MEAPVVIKDPLGGSSIGVWVCYTDEDLRNAIAECQQLGGEFLIEEYVSGIEITVALLDGEALPVITIIPHNEYFDLEAKYTKGQTTYLPHKAQKRLSRQKVWSLEELALSAQEQARWRLIPFLECEVCAEQILLFHALANIQMFH